MRHRWFLVEGSDLERGNIHRRCSLENFFSNFAYKKLTFYTHTFPTTRIVTTTASWKGESTRREILEDVSEITDKSDNSVLAYNLLRSPTTKFATIAETLYFHDPELREPFSNEMENKKEVFLKRGFKTFSRGKEIEMNSSEITEEIRKMHNKFEKIGGGYCIMTFYDSNFLGSCHCTLREGEEDD